MVEIYVVEMVGIEINNEYDEFIVDLCKLILVNDI